MKNFLERLNIDFSKFTLTDDDFKIQSDIHDIGHVYRVMFNTILLGCELDDVLNTRISFCGALIHDLSRKHDGGCERHGYDSVVENFDKYKQLFMSVLKEHDLEGVSKSCWYHSMVEEIDKNDKHYKPISILKDADALDRIRLGNLDPNYLRFKESHGLIDKSEKLFLEYKDYDSFEEFLFNNLD